jgi:hypothetical protein
MLTTLRASQTAVAAHEYRPVSSHTPVGPIAALAAVLIAAAATSGHSSASRVS